MFKNMFDLFVEKDLIRSIKNTAKFGNVVGQIIWALLAFGATFYFGIWDEWGLIWGCLFTYVIGEVGSLGLRVLYQILFCLGAILERMNGSMVTTNDTANSSATISINRSQKEWECPSCGYRNGRMTAYCENCGSDLK